MSLLQEVADARVIRNQILTNFELASHVALSEEEKRRVLHTVVVGGGPTGVEFSAELHDFLQQVCVCSIVRFLFTCLIPVHLFPDCRILSVCILMSGTL